jgi:hypothetical protein
VGDCWRDRGCGPGLTIPLGVMVANVGCKLLVALQLESAHHFIEGCAGGRTGRREPPPTFGATKTAKKLMLNPDQLPTHGGPRRYTPSPSDLMPGLASGFVCGHETCNSQSVLLAHPHTA